MSKSLDKMNDSQYYKLYDELLEISLQLEPYYDIDKVKPYGVYVWYKNENVFDIYAEEIVFYKKHKIKKKFVPIVQQIQSKLKEMSRGKR